MLNKVLVTGGTGWIGKAVCAELKSRGIDAVVLDRAEAGEGLPRFVPVDLSTDEGLREALATDECREADALIHCAGYAHRPIETPEEVERFFAINRDGTSRVIRLCEECDIPRMVYLSSIAFYDWESLAGSPANEDSPLAAPTAYARSKLEGEQAVRDCSLDWRVARLATVVGNGDRANFSKLAGALRRKRFLLPGKGEARKSVLAVETAARLLVDFALVDDPEYRMLNLSEGPTPTLGEICEAYAETCEFPKPASLPLPLFRLLAKAGDIASLLKKDFPLNSRNLKKLTTSTEVDSQRMKKVFPQYEERTFAEILRATADWYRNC